MDCILMDGTALVCGEIEPGLWDCIIVWPPDDTEAPDQSDVSHPILDALVTVETPQVAVQGSGPAKPDFVAPKRNLPRLSAKREGGSAKRTKRRLMKASASMTSRLTGCYPLWTQTLA
jgi:hypothetical protein